MYPSGVIPYPLMLIKGRDPKFGVFYGYAVRCISWLFAMKFIIDGEENLKDKPVGIIMMNHQCFLDKLPIAAIMPLSGALSIIMKKELQYVPLFGFSAYMSGQIFIKREDREGAVKVINEQKQIFEQKRNMMLVFPEGTRNRQRILRPFKKGAFHLAIETKCPIYPIVVAPFYSYDDVLRVFDSGTFRIRILPPVETKELTTKDVPKLVEEIQSRMQSEFNELWKETQLYRPF